MFDNMKETINIGLILHEAADNHSDRFEQERSLNGWKLFFDTQDTEWPKIYQNDQFELYLPKVVDLFERYLRRKAAII